MPDIDYKTRSRNGGNAQNQTGAWRATGKATGERYRYIEDKPQDGANGANADGANASTTAAAKTRSRPNAEYVLYSNGEPVAVNADGDTSYFGTDILGSVRSVTDKYGNVKAQYEYDAFGSPYLSNIDSGMSFGYTGKIFDSTRLFACANSYEFCFRGFVSFCEAKSCRYRLCR
ncbi:MAG: hypothetical protein MJ159_05005 [Treponemataceae bacterium]|nr:hypothetical protein [Treponemataceae bacterium]